MAAEFNGALSRETQADCCSATSKGVSVGGATRPPSTPCLHLRQQRVVAEDLPTHLGVVDGDDQPAVGRGARGVEELALGQPAVAGVNGRDGRLVLLLGTAGEVVHDAVRP